MPPSMDIQRQEPSPGNRHFSGLWMKEIDVKWFFLLDGALVVGTRYSASAVVSQQYLLVHTTYVGTSV